MKIGVLGSGDVGAAIATKLVQLGHDVKMGSRTANSDKGTAWAKKVGGSASTGTFADAAAHGEIVFVCTKGDASLETAKAAAAQLKGKILVDVSNPLDFSKGFPSLFVMATDSLAEQIQRALPETHVVKTLNTVNNSLMTDPGHLSQPTTMFISGNDAASKGKVKEILTGWFGWKDVLDLGDITGARAQEAYLLLWIRCYGAMKSGDFNIAIVKK
jgi:8-hydroxy-5-deazaflavin:NADPH oxidoreductase